MKNLGNVVEGKDIANVETINKVSGNGSTLVKAPIGTIVIWSGTVDDIPTGWHLCDGTNGTPDLRDKFVLGAGSSHDVGDSGGEEAHTLSVDEMPSHSHSYNVGMNTSISTDDGLTPLIMVDSSTNENGIHFTGGSQPHNNMPPYYTLCYIMKLTADETDCGDVYSTEEIKIGTWIDGKPLYRKVIEFTYPNSKNGTKIYTIPAVTVRRMYGGILDGNTASPLFSPRNSWR